PLIVGETTSAPRNNTVIDLKVQNLELPKDIGREQNDARLGLLEGLQTDFQSRHGAVAQGHDVAYKRAVRMMRSEAVRAFNLDEEKAALRDAYGRTQFGQGCLLARRLIERGVPYVEVTLSLETKNPGFAAFPWDTHYQNFEVVKQLSQVLDS